MRISDWSSDVCSSDIFGPKIGSFAGSSFPQPGGTGPDYAWIRADAGNNLQPTVYGWGMGDVTVTGHAEAPIGAAICRSGRTTGWHCGAIQAKNVTVNYSSGETVLNLTQTTACPEGGDSGGSYISGTGQRSEEHTSKLPSLMRISYAVFCLKKKN